MNNNNSLQALQQAQLTLSTALSYFLYNSVANALPTGAFGRFCVIRSNPLVSCVAFFKTANIPIPIVLQKVTQRHITIKKYASILAHLYQNWEVAVTDIKHGKGNTSQKGTISKGRGYNSWLSSGGNITHYRPVHQLRRLLKNRGSEFFIRGIVHGSIATFDDTPGFSDMDLSFVIKTSVLIDPNMLLSLRALTAALSRCLHNMLILH